MISHENNSAIISENEHRQFIKNHEYEYPDETPMMYACIKNNVDVVRYLIENNETKMEHKNSFGWTALNYAVKHSSLDLIELLLKNGAIIDNNDNPFMSVLNYCYDFGRDDVTNLVKRYAAYQKL